MSPFGIFAIVAGGALLLSAAKTIKTALNIDYKILGFGIYNFIKGSNIIFRLRMRFFNPNDRRINVQYINIAAFWGATYETAASGKITNVISKGTELTRVTDTNGFVIDANSYTDVVLFLETSWLNLLKIIGGSALNIIIGGNDFNLRDFLGKAILIEGTVKAEGVKVNILTDCVLIDDRNN